MVVFADSDVLQPGIDGLADLRRLRDVSKQVCRVNLRVWQGLAGTEPVAAGEDKRCGKSALVQKKRLQPCDKLYELILLRLVLGRLEVCEGKSEDWVVWADLRSLADGTTLEAWLGDAWVRAVSKRGLL